jgi:hypothetical protein
MDSLERRLLVGLLEEALPALREYFRAPQVWDGTEWPLDFGSPSFGSPSVPSEYVVGNGRYCPACGEGGFSAHKNDCAGMRLVADVTLVVKRLKAAVGIVEGAER